MKNKTVAQVQADLQAIADQHGETRFEAAKAAYLSRVIIVDDEGSVVKGADLKFDIKFETPAAGAAKAADPAGDISKIASAVAAELRKGAVSETGKAADIAKAYTGPRIESVSVRSKVFSTSEEAYKFGAWCAAIAGAPWAKQFCADKGIGMEKAMSAGSNADGGFLIPIEFEPTVLRLVEKYGIFRQNAKMVPVQGDSYTYPRRKSGVTAYFTAEGVAGTESTPKYDLITLTPRELMALSKSSNKLNEASAVSIADELATEFGIAFAYTEDNCGFNGDGTSTYGGITGARAALRAVDTTISNIKGLYVGTGNLYSELVLADFNNVAGLLPQYAEAGAKWYCHKKFWESVMKKLALAAGGVTAQEIISGVRTPTFLGYPVVVSQVMPSTEANSQVCCLFGDLAMAADFGQKSGMSIAVSDSALNAFEKNQLCWRGVSSFDAVVHDVGNTTDAGPLVGLITAAS